MTFYLSLPVDTILNAVDDLMEILEQTGIPMTSEQSVNLADVIFACQPILIQDLRAWHKKTAIEKNLAEHEDSLL